MVSFSIMLLKQEKTEKIYFMLIKMVLCIFIIYFTGMLALSCSESLLGEGMEYVAHVVCQ